MSPEAGSVSDESTGVITRLLMEWRSGDERALEELTPLVYRDLQRLAGSYLQHEREGHTLETQDLIHEAFLRLLDQQRVDWRSRAHFFAIAAQMMRRILVDHARRRSRVKHGSGQVIGLSRVEVPTPMPDLDVVALDDALTELGQADATLARIVEMRFFGGLEHDEIAAVLGVSNATARRRWRMAKAWLFARLQRGEGARV